MGHVVEVIGPDRFRTVPCPTYPDIALSLLPRRRLIRMIEAFSPDALHIATEGPLGLAARSWAKRTGFAFTTAFHTRFAEYVKARTGLPVRPIYAWMRRFHGAGQGTMVATQSLRDELSARGFRNIRSWSRGVDLDLFKPVSARCVRGSAAADLHLCRAGGGGEEHRRVPGSGFAGIEGRGGRRPAAGRRCSGLIPGSRSPGRATARRWPGPMPAADVFVFPSRTDTFGLVILEALACGTPVAAFPVTGPKDVLTNADGQDRFGQRGSAGGGAGCADARIGWPAGCMRSDTRGGPARRFSCRIWCR